MTEQQEIQLILNAGLDPERVFIKDGKFMQSSIPLRYLPGITKKQEVKKQQESTATDAFLRRAKRAIVPTAAGLGGAALVAGSGGLALPLLAGIGGGVGGSLLQDAFNPLTEEEIEQRAADEEQHPVASFFGDVAPSVAAIRPSPSALKSAVRGVARFARTGTAATAAERAAIQNAAVGTGVDVGVEGGAQILQGEFDPLRLGLSAVTGATLTKPTFIGSAMGFRDPGVLDDVSHLSRGKAVESDVSSDTLGTKPVIRNARKVSDRVESLEGIKTEVAREKAKRSVVAGQARVRQARQAERIDLPRFRKPEEERRLRLPEVSEADRPGTVEQARNPETGRIELPGPPPPKPRDPDLPKEAKDITWRDMAETVEHPEGVISYHGNPVRDYTKYNRFTAKTAKQQATIKTKIINGQRKVDELFKKMLNQVSNKRQQKTIDKTADELNNALDNLNLEAAESGFNIYKNPRTVRLIEKAKQISPRMQGQADMALKGAKGKPKNLQEFLDTEFDGVKFQNRSNLQSTKIRGLMERLGINPVLAGNTTMRQFMHELAARRGVTLEEGAIDTGQVGKAFLQERIARIDVDNLSAGLDTPLHEVAHVFLRDLKDNGSTFEKRLFNEGVKAFGSEEALVEGIGIKGVENWIKKNSVIEFLKDFWSHVKVRFENGSDKDYERLLARKLLDDPSFSHVKDPNPTIASSQFTTAIVAGSVRKEFKPLLRSKGKLIKMFDEGKYDDVKKNLSISNVSDLAKTVAGDHVQRQLDEITDLINKGTEASLEKARAMLSDLSLPNDRVIEAAVKANEAFQTESSISYNKMKTTEPTGKADEKRGFLKFFEGMVDRIKKVDQKVGEAFNERARLAVRLEGTLANNYMFKLAKGKYTKQEVDNVLKWRFHRYNGEQSDIVSLTPREMQVNAMFEEQHELTRIIQQAYGLQVKDGDGYREGGFNRKYQPSIISKDVAEALRTFDHPDRQTYIRDIAEWWLKKSDPKKVKDYDIGKAMRDAEDYAIALASDRATNTEKHFGALRKAKGLGLPWHLVEQDGANAMQRYGSRAARDLSWFRTIESDNYVRSRLDMPDQFGSRESNDKNIKILKDDRITKLVRFVDNHLDPLEQGLQSANRFVTSTFLGPATVARDILSSYVNSLPYMNLSDIPLFLKAYKNLSQAWADSFRLGVNRSNILELEYQGSATNKILEGFDKLSSTISKYQGRNLGEQFSRAHNFSLGQLVAQAQLGRAKRGDRGAMKFLDQFLNGVSNTKEVIERGSFTKAELDEIGASFVERVQGTYDERNLPAFAQTGILRPFFALSRWGIEKSNVIYQDVVQPMQRGEEGSMQRFLLYTFGAIMGGEAITHLSEMLNNRRKETPSLVETSKSQFSDEADAVKALVQAMQMSGYAGMMSDFIRRGSVIMQEGNDQDQFSWPLKDFLSETLLKNAVKASEALQDGEPVMDVMVQFVHEGLNSSLQAYRIAYNNVIAPDEADRKDKLRDLRVFRRQTDRDVPPFYEGGNQFKGILERKFKRSLNEFEVEGLAAQAIERAIAKSKGDPEKLGDLLQGLRVLPVKELPNPDENWEEFMEFIEYIEATQGKKAAQALVEFYDTKKAMQTFKKQLLR